MDYKAWIIPQDTLSLTMDLADFKEVE